MRVRLVDDPHAEVGEDVRVGVGVIVGVVEFQLKQSIIERITSHLTSSDLISADLISSELSTL